MSKLSLRIENSDGNVITECSNLEYVNLVYSEEYCPGNRIILSVDNPGAFLMIQLDDVMNPSFIYMKDTTYTFEIPFGEKAVSYNPKAFTGNVHLLKARVATAAEISVYKNLALNEYDTHENTSCYPHASANVETRGEAVFAARNAIDGNTENHYHGLWPYESWGINKNPNAELILDFGRQVEIDKIILYTRADFPHDSWWKSASIQFSDGSSQTVTMEKSDKPHIFSIEKRKVSWVKLWKLVKDENDPSPFPALSQIEVYGHETIG